MIKMYGYQIRYNNIYVCYIFVFAKHYIHFSNSKLAKQRKGSEANVCLNTFNLGYT